MENNPERKQSSQQSGKMLEIHVLGTGRHTNKRAQQTRALSRVSRPRPTRPNSNAVAVASQVSSFK